MPQFDDTVEKTRLQELYHKEEEELVAALAPKYGYEYIDLQGITIDPTALRTVPEETAREAELIVFARGHRNLKVALRNPNSEKAQDILAQLHEDGTELDLYMASRKSIEHGLKRYHDAVQATAEKKGILDVDPDEIERLSKEFDSYDDVAERVRTLEHEAGAEQTTETIEALFGGALAVNASDIHVEPEPSGAVRIRYRVDGVLFDVTNITHATYEHVLSRLKLLSGLKLNVHDEAQDGRFTFDTGARELEIRSSAIPGAHGESFVMRLLDPNAATFKLENLGLNDALYAVMEEELKRPNGAIVTTGPTGSGKTTALYAFLQEVHNPEVKIITIEDPVEYRLPGIVQTQVGEDYAFASGLRSILRQDPDVIMVGEIRDRDVAETTVHAALTGHLVFTTLHTNSAVGAFPRLLDLGVDSRMVGSAFNIILGQRLVRLLCEHCTYARDATPEEQTLMARVMERPVKEHTIYEAKGCKQCGGSGYKGRIGIFEGIRVDKAVEDAIIGDPREHVIREAARPQGIPTMQQDGIMKVLKGLTSLEEVARVTDLYNTRMTPEGQQEDGAADEGAV